MKNLIKSFSLSFMLCISTFVYGQTVSIAGEKHPVIDKTETYIVENHPKTSGKEAYWRIEGGTFFNGGKSLMQDVENNKVSVVWSQVSQGTLYYSYGNYSGQITVVPKENSGEEPPSIINPTMSIDVSGTYKTYNKIHFSANYDHTGIYIKGQPEYKWTFNNEGAITTYTGKSLTLSFSKVGRLDVLLEVSVRTTGGNTRTNNTTTMINIADGTLDPPILYGIDGKTKIPFVNTYEYFFASVGSSYPNIKYEWTLVHGSTVTDLENSISVGYMFTEKGDYNIRCKMTNTKTGASVSEIKYFVVGEEYDIQRVEISKPICSISHNNNILMISSIDDNSSQTFSNQQTFSYHIYNLLTGILVESGSTISGSYIDINKLAKGIYLLKLKNETKEQTYKFTKR